MKSFLRRYVFSLDHKVIGLQYGITASVFLLLGFALIAILRWQLAYPGEALPWIGGLLGEGNAPDGVLQPEFYNTLGAMHGTIMIFLAIVPLVVGAFGNYLVPLMIGAPDMAFPRLNMLSYWVYLVGGVVMFSSFWAPGGAAKSGWTSYPPLSVIEGVGQSVWLVAMALLITSSMLGAVNIIVTILQLRAPGLTLMRLPFFVWSQLVTNFLLLIAFPPLEAAAILQLMDRVAGTSFFMPSGLLVSGQAVEVAGGGSPLLWQHLFWFLAHPEVYVLILPAMGIVAEIIAANTRRPLFGYRAMVYSSLFLGGMSFIVWAHHMFLTGMGTTISAFFQVTTMIISVPSVVILTALLLTLWGGSIRFTTPMLFALAFLPMFGIGGLTGLPLGLAAADIQLHDTYYVIGHFHYIVAPGTIFAIFAGIYFWFPKITGRQMNETLGRLHFWPSFLFMNGVFMPMFIQGLAGMSRRLYDGGAGHAYLQDVVPLHTMITWSAWALGLSQIPFLINLVWSVRSGAPVCSNPWQATGLEWAAPSPPLGHGNFTEPVAVYAGPYLYADSEHGFRPQHLNLQDVAPHANESAKTEIPYTVETRPDTGLYNARFGMWLFIASEVMLFGGLFSSYLLLRISAGDSWPTAAEFLHPGLAAANSFLLIASSVTFVAAWKALQSDVDSQGMASERAAKRFHLFLLVTCALGAAFLAIKGYEYRIEWSHGYRPSTNNFFGMYWVLTGLHGLHLIGGLILNLFLLGPGASMRRSEPVRFLHRAEVAGLYWHFVDLVWIVLFPTLYLF